MKNITTWKSNDKNVAFDKFCSTISGCFNKTLCNLSNYELLIDSIRQNQHVLIVDGTQITPQLLIELLTPLAKGVYGYVYASDIEQVIVFCDQTERYAKELTETINSGIWNEDPNNPRNAFVALLKRWNISVNADKQDFVSLQAGSWRDRTIKV